MDGAYDGGVRMSRGGQSIYYWLDRTQYRRVSEVNTTLTPRRRIPTKGGTSRLRHQGPPPRSGPSPRGFFRHSLVGPVPHFPT